MLVLTRKRNESIIVGDNIKITIVEVKGDQVKLGITAPKDVSIHREEIFMEIQKENELAAGRFNQDVAWGCYEGLGFLPVVGISKQLVDFREREKRGETISEYEIMFFLVTSGAEIVGTGAGTLGLLDDLARLGKLDDLARVGKSVPGAPPKSPLSPSWPEPPVHVVRLACGLLG